MVLNCSRTFKSETKEDSLNVMLVLTIKMTNNKDTKHKTNVIHTKLTMDIHAQPMFSNDYSESFITFQKPVGKTHNCSILLKGLKKKKKRLKKKVKKDKKIKKKQKRY